MPPNQPSLQNLVNSMENLSAMENPGTDNSIQAFPDFTQTLTRQASTSNNDIHSSAKKSTVFRCAILGCGMMGQEHISYIMGYLNEIRIDFLCDPFEPSLEKSVEIMEEYYRIMSNKNTSNNLKSNDFQLPQLLKSEDDLLRYASDIDLLVIATPNYLHTDSLLKWAAYDVTILVEKPVAVSYEQHERLRKQFLRNNNNKARIWVAMEYRYIPAIAKLISLLPTIGEIKMITIRENRYPFLHKIGKWNRDRTKTGDTLVEKCCHFFDLFRLISQKEMDLNKVRALAQRGLNYQDEPEYQDVQTGYHTPIIDSAYVVMPFDSNNSSNGERNNYGLSEEKGKSNSNTTASTIGCLELCMYAEGSRHQEEIIVTGTKGRLEAYLPENMVYSFKRPSDELWNDRSVPPPTNAIQQKTYNCSSIRDVHGIDPNVHIPTHGGYHYSSTGVEWYKLLTAMKKFRDSGTENITDRIFVPEVSLEDGLRAIEIGLRATSAIVNEQRQE